GDSGVHSGQLASHRKGAPMYVKRLIVVLVAGSAAIVAAASAIGSHAILPPKTTTTGAVMKSPNGLYSIEVRDDGITLKGPTGVVTLNQWGFKATAQQAVTLLAGTNAVVQASQDAWLKAGGNVYASAVAKLNLNGCAAPVARVGDSVASASGG